MIKQVIGFIKRTFNKERTVDGYGSNKDLFIIDEESEIPNAESELKGFEESEIPSYDEFFERVRGFEKIKKVVDRDNLNLSNDDIRKIVTNIQGSNPILLKSDFESELIKELNDYDESQKTNHHNFGMAVEPRDNFYHTARCKSVNADDGIYFEDIAASRKLKNNKYLIIAKRTKNRRIKNKNLARANMEVG